MKDVLAPIRLTLRPHHLINKQTLPSPLTKLTFLPNGNQQKFLSWA